MFGNVKGTSRGVAALSVALAPLQGASKHPLADMAHRARVAAPPQRHASSALSRDPRAEQCVGPACTSCNW